MQANASGCDGHQHLPRQLGMQLPAYTFDQIRKPQVPETRYAQKNYAGRHGRRQRHQRVKIGVKGANDTIQFAGTFKDRFVARFGQTQIANVQGIDPSI